jgi:hypothetical protein
MRHRTKLEGSKGIRKQGSRQQLRLRKEGSSGRISRKTIRLEIVKRTVESPVRI